MNIMAFSDTHGEVDVSKFDLTGISVCVIAGDISPCRTGSPIHLPFAQIGALAKDNPEVKFVVVPGNHDFVFDDHHYMFKPTVPLSRCFTKNVHVLIDNGIEIDGVRFWGSPWIPRINGRWAFESVDDLEESDIDRKFAQIPGDTDVLITHSPPAFDDSDVDRSRIGHSSERTSHFGSISLAKHIKRVMPDVCIFGHVHTGDHVCNVLLENGKIARDTRLDKTWGNKHSLLYNVSMLDENYEHYYEPLILSYDKKTANVWEIVS